MCEVCCFYKQNTAYVVRSSDWSSDVCSSCLCTEVVAHTHFKAIVVAGLNCALHIERIGQLIERAETRRRTVIIVTHVDIADARIQFATGVWHRPAQTRTQAEAALVTVAIVEMLVLGTGLQVETSEERRIGKEGV